MDKFTALVQAAKVFWAQVSDPNLNYLAKFAAVVSFLNLITTTFINTPKAALPDGFHAEMKKCHAAGDMTAEQHFAVMQLAADAGAGGQLLAAVLAFLQALPQLLPTLAGFLPFIQQIIDLFKKAPTPSNPNIKGD